MSSQTSPVTLEKLVALCKRRGFIYQSAEIYGGLNGVYDAGHLGALMKQNIRNAWRSAISSNHLDVVFLEGALLGPQAMWEASGHLEGFHDPMVDCMQCKHRYRADHIDLNKACPHCGKKAWTDVRQFNMMFKTDVGAAAENATTAYLRPETAQSIFVNFKNVLSTNRVKVPFGIAQIGKAFRNEITPKQFLFRMREFEQMELEWFCKPEDTDKFFTFWTEHREKFYTTIGINPSKIRLRPHGADELAHYSTKCVDVEYEFPFGWKELEGIADRGNYDLRRHMEYSGKDLRVYDDETKESYIPHVVECSVGTDRLFLTLLFDAYSEDIVEGEERIVLKLNPKIAPVKAAFFPLSKKLNDQTLAIYHDIKKKLGLELIFDDSGSIGKRYRRQDEIGTPVCFTYDFDSETDNSVTARNRDTTKQERIAIDNIVPYLKDLLI
ncbi:MAG TPA: glycine--tRNA ligase [Candidatus Dependentiae bacterium]|nr:glycine--tRNA ligase [Candidatus Dependentiae bacterium]HRQ62426.1 glycine--tRNA ligase [Candidatus Dependentiae bacterium]